MVALDTTGPLNPLGHAFTFADPAQRAALGPGDLTGPASVRALEASLKAAQDGAFAAFDHLTPLIAIDRRRSVWIPAALLYGFAAPVSAIRQLLAAVEEAWLSERQTLLQGACLRMMVYSGQTAFFDDILRLLAVFNDPEDSFEAALLLDRLLVPEGSADGPNARYQRDPTAIIAGGVARTRFIDAVEALMRRAEAGPTIYAGRSLDYYAVAANLLEHLPRPPDMTRIYEERLILEAATGHDLSGFYRQLQLQPAQAAELLEAAFDSGAFDDLAPGQRYFFGRSMPA